MKIILHHPDSESGKQTLTDLYNVAISEAIELFIVTAYLTDWKPKSKIRVDCEEMSFIVGTDFGITTKAACKAVLSWIPKNMKNDFLAADRISGFHPKLIAWKTTMGDYKLMLGSSNLTQAAFSSNYEANIFSNISSEQYNDIKEWIYSIRLQCSPISEDWLDKNYKEMNKADRGQGGKKPPVVLFNLPAGKDIDMAIQTRRQQDAFTEIKEQMIVLIEKCSKSQISNDKFYSNMMSLWRDKTRFQGRGFEIKGKHGDWKDVCTSLSAILSKSSSFSIGALDSLVRKEVDRLADNNNPSRGAWLSEMLCHFFPERYPLLNKPVKIWLQSNKYRGPRKASEGATYIDLAVKLRDALKNNNDNIANNLSELDHAIWKWYDNKYGKD